MAAASYFASLTDDEKEMITSLDQPYKIQAFLDSVKYPAGERNRSVLNVLREKQAHCLDGGTFAAAALCRIGFPPLIVDLIPEVGEDDDHVLAIFKVDGFWGAVAKSNYVGLRYREPVYRTLRDLVMSYFDVFYNINYQRTLRAFTRPVNLARFDSLHWDVCDEGVDAIEKFLKTLPNTPLLTPSQINSLTPVDSISYQAGMMMVNPEGLFKPKTP